MPVLDGGASRTSGAPFTSRRTSSPWSTSTTTRSLGCLLSSIGALRQTMVCHYLTNFAGDDAWIYRMRYDFRKFNYMGDVTWLSGEITAARVDPTLGPLIEVTVRGTNQRGQDNIAASATILVASRETGLCQLPPAPPPPVHRQT